MPGNSQRPLNRKHGKLDYFFGRQRKEHRKQGKKSPVEDITHPPEVVEQILATLDRLDFICEEYQKYLAKTE